jgi:peptidoglycan/LPS O-acetylase OafA/YrhL
MRIPYRPEIDGLRAIAVGIVIIHHAPTNDFILRMFKGGYLGVDIFFVISGYLISSIIFKELYLTNNFSFKNFYERRVRRILPALLFVMVISLPFAWFYLLPVDLIEFCNSILSSVGLTSNVYFHYSGQKYGGLDSLANPFLHTWSLSVEEQYYIFFPILILLVFRYLKKYLIYFLFSIFLISLFLADWSSKNYPSISFYFLHTRIWELLAGSFLAYYEVITKQRSTNKTLKLILPTIGIILILLSVLFFNNKTFHPSIYTLIPVIGVCLIIWFANPDEPVTKILSSKLFVGVGLISYSLYLWHYPIFAFVRYYAGNWLFGESYILKYKIYYFLLILISILSFIYVEKPFRKKSFNFKKILSLITIFITIICSFSIFTIFSNITEKKNHPLLTKHYGDKKNFNINYNYFSNKNNNIFIFGDSYSNDLINSFFYNKKLFKKYNFYTIESENENHIYGVQCFYEFFLNEKKNCNKINFSSLKKQYSNSNYIILHTRDNVFYTSKNFETVIEYLKKDKKKFVVLLNDINDANVLDKYLLKWKKIPNDNQLQSLEKKLYEMTKVFDKNKINFIKNNFNKNSINYMLRSEIYCDNYKKKCPLIMNGEKVYKDYGHLTNNGAKNFSKNLNQLILKLTNN